MMRLYLSSSIVNGPLNLKLRAHLPVPRFELILPQEFSPVGRSRAEYPLAIYQRCIEEMERCDAGLLLLDSFGVDCAAEAGWFSAHRKPLIGLATGSLKFLQHWMVKGSLTGVVSLDATIAAEVAADSILGGMDTRLANDWSALADTLEALLRSQLPARTAA